MKAKWYIGALIIILAVVGISLEQIAIPNQEIVVQFADDDVSSSEAQETIAIVKKQLQSIGADNIQISESEQGSFKFTYYSKIDVASIKEIFSTRVPLEALAETQEKRLALGYTSYSHNDDQTEIPSEENTNRYELNVCEIQKSNDLDSDFNGILVKLSRENDRLVNPNLCYSFDVLDTWKSKEIQKSTYLVQRKIALTIETARHSIPEVRAGPQTGGRLI